jgi:hypothetical protein
MKRKITFKEGYRLMREVGADWLSSVFMAFVWVLRGDEIESFKGNK